MKDQLATRVDAPLGQRLRVYAAVNRCTLADVVGAALDSYLPSLADLVRDAAAESADGAAAAAPAAGTHVEEVAGLLSVNHAAIVTRAGAPREAREIPGGAR
jgi:hypothetical protein